MAGADACGRPQPSRRSSAAIRPTMRREAAAPGAPRSELVLASHARLGHITHRRDGCCILAACPVGLWDTDTVAARTGLSPLMVRFLVAQRCISHLACGDRVQFVPAAVEAWAALCGPPSTRTPPGVPTTCSATGHPRVVTDRRPYSPEPAHPRSPAEPPVRSRVGPWPWPSGQPHPGSSLAHAPASVLPRSTEVLSTRRWVTPGSTAGHPTMCLAVRTCHDGCRLALSGLHPEARARRESCRQTQARGRNWSVPAKAA